jgi:hypothetical protein
MVSISVEQAHDSSQRMKGWVIFWKRVNTASVFHVQIVHLGHIEDGP